MKREKEKKLPTTTTIFELNFSLLTSVNFFGNNFIFSARLPTFSEMDKKFCCNICGCYFASNQSRQRHVSTVHCEDKRPFICEKCDAPFSNNMSMKRHVVEMHENRCLHCESEFSTQTSLSLHHRIEHSDIYKFYCTGFKCHSVFGTLDDLLEHTFAVHKPFWCRWCDAKFSLRFLRERHVAVVHPESVSFVCEICDKKTVNLENLKRHIKELHDNLKFKCKFCDYQCGRRNRLLNHLSAIHDEKTPFHCDGCDAKFGTSQLLRQHKQTVHRNRNQRPKEPAFVCLICKKAFVFANALSRHSLEVHGTGQAYQCLICDKKYTCRKGLADHVRIQHENIKKYVCPICDRRFGRNSEWHNHISLVHENPQFLCEICGTSFRRKTFLNTHMKKIHPCDQAN